MSDKLTKEVLQRAKEKMMQHDPTQVVFVVRTNEKRAKEIVADFGVEWTPDENGTMVIGEWHIMTAPLFP